MLLHDQAVLRENWEVDLRPSHPHQLSDPDEQATLSTKASPSAEDLLKA